MKKILPITVFGTILVMGLFVLTGCDNTKISEKSDVDAENIVEQEENNQKNENSTNKETNVVEKEENNKEKDTASNVEPTAKKELGEKFVDLDNRSFMVNGKVYTLGVNTLQEMIDDGVPFDEDDLANANNNINKNAESQSFKIVLGKYYSAQVRVTNESDENMKIADCKLSEIYLPVHQDKEQDIIDFAFPLTITEEELLANAGEPTDQSEYNGSENYKTKTFKYMVDSTKYYGESGYKFEFANGELSYITITYKP